MHISAAEALEKLEATGNAFQRLFTHGTLSVEVYKPLQQDNQQPHEQDEVYVIMAGEGDFINGNEKRRFKAGDFLFVPAGVVHRFEDFSDDFCTWVIFFGPPGGEHIIS